MPDDAANASLSLGTWPIEVLGSTETGGVGWRTQENGNKAWEPLPGVGVILSDAGEIRVQSAHADGDGVCDLGDHGALLPDGRFQISGRVGPVMKVEGVRVSMVRVEESISALEDIARCRTLLIPGLPERLAAVATLTPVGLEKLAEAGSFRFSRTLRNALSGELSPAERPKSWRFVEHLPMNSHGKVTLETLQSLFIDGVANGDTLPLTEIEAHETEASVGLHLSDSMPWFEGHFPGQPILPGIAQVHMAMQAAQQIWDWQPEGSNLMKLKFKRVARPGDHLSLHLRRDIGKALLWFRFERDGTETASGRIGGRG